MWVLFGVAVPRKRALPQHALRRAPLAFLRLNDQGFEVYDLSLKNIVQRLCCVTNVQPAPLRHQFPPTKVTPFSHRERRHRHTAMGAAMGG